MHLCAIHIGQASSRFAISEPFTLSLPQAVVRWTVDYKKEGHYHCEKIRSLEAVAGLAGRVLVELLSRLAHLNSSFMVR